MTLPTLYWFCKSVVVAVSAEDFIVDVLGLEGKYFTGTFPNSDSGFVRQRNNSAGAVDSSVNALWYFSAKKIAGFIGVSRFALRLTPGEAVLVCTNDLTFTVTNCFKCTQPNQLFDVDQCCRNVKNCQHLNEIMGITTLYLFSEF